VLCDPATGADCAPFINGYDIGAGSWGRLNRTFYNNTVRDLLGTQLTPATQFPADELALGFDTIGATLRVQPEHVERYLEATGALIDDLFARGAADPYYAAFVTCDPATGGECHTQILVNFATKAWRRPVDPSELAPYAGLVALEATPVDGIKAAMRGVLMSPNFMYRVERDPNPADPTPHPLGGYELASRLSYFLWGTMPDDTLFAAAGAGTLATAEGLEAELNRLLSDPARTRTLVDYFGSQWLNVFKVRGATPDLETYPSFDDPLREAMVTETQMVLWDFFASDTPLAGMLTTPTTWLNERLATHYGVPGVSGEAFQQVDASVGNRFGVLTHGSFLTGTSNPTNTSPVKRGKHVMERFLCTPPPPPPPDVDTNLEEGPGVENLSVRERLMQHQQKGAVCYSCHQVMDAIGLGLENYDGIGAYRTSDEYGAIDASASLPPPSGGDPVAFNGAAELSAILAQDPRLVTCAVDRLLTYSLGRDFTSARDMKNVISTIARVNGGSVQDAIRAVVLSDTFRNRSAGTAAAAAAAPTAGTEG
jgi:hypothetical protein